MFAVSALVFGSAFACPGSYGIIHAGAKMNLEFKNSCQEVAAEIEARASAPLTMWQDPHNDGIYKLLKNDGNYILTSRTTKNHQYTDKQDFTLRPNGSGCSVVACSESQGISAADGGTNFCDMFDLFCNSTDCSGGNCCKVLKNNLQYTIESKQCTPFFFNCPKNRAAELKTCLRNPSTEEDLAAFQSNALLLQRMGAFDTQEANFEE